MRRLAPVVLSAAALLLCLDVAGALGAIPLGFPYSRLAVVSLAVYLAVGAVGGWRVGFAGGVAAAMLVGFLDGTLGPLTAWLVGSGPVGEPVSESGVFVYGIVAVTAAAGAAGLVGAAAGSWLERRRGSRGAPVGPA